MIFRWVCRGLAVLLLCCVVNTANAEIQKLEISLASDAVTRYTSPDSTLSDCYVVALDVPDAVKAGKLVSAMLEFYGDVSAKPINGWVNETPVIELYGLNRSISEGVDLSVAEEPSAAVKAVRIGEKHRIVLDVTSILRAWLEDPARNHGMILGSLRGGREGVFELRIDELGPGQVARITILYRLDTAQEVTE